MGFSHNWLPATLSQSKPSSSAFISSLTKISSTFSKFKKKFKIMYSSSLSLFLGCEHRHLLPSHRLPVSIPIHVVILPFQSTLSSGSFSLQNKLAIQAPTCFSKHSPSLHLGLQSTRCQPFFPLLPLLLSPGMFLLCSSLPRLPSIQFLGGCWFSLWPFPI